jgi:mRNA-degrading endonuclease toxin of MazEF toxin-antitoxin module
VKSGSKTRLKERMGEVTSAEMAEIEQAIKIHLQLI